MIFTLKVVKQTEYAQEMARLGLVHENEDRCTYAREVKAKSETQAVMRFMKEEWDGGKTNKPIVYAINNGDNSSISC